MFFLLFLLMQPENQIHDRHQVEITHLF